MMEPILYDQVLTSYFPGDFLGFLNQLWPLFLVGILLGVVAWLISIVVYTVFRLLEKMV